MTTKSPTSSTGTIIRFIIAACILVIAALALTGIRTHKERAHTNEQLQSLIEQNEALKQSLAEIQHELATAKETIDQFNSGDSSEATKEKMAQSRTERTKEKPVEEKAETFVLQEPTVETASDGLLVHFEYMPEPEVRLPDNVALVIRVPKSGTTRILSLESDTGAKARINAAGTLGLVECNTSDLNKLTFDLKVSEAVTATVHGSTGFIEFEIDITPDGCVVRQL